MNYDFRCQSKPGEDGAGPSCQDSACLHFSDGLERQRETLTKLPAVQEPGPVCSSAIVWFWVHHTGTVTQFLPVGY